jgi:nuclear cap-binding protein subunit 2
MGLDRFKKVPCGFAFVEFRHRIDALGAVANLTGTKLDGLPIRVELDAGFKPGRQYGRGTSGGQVRDDRGGGGGKKRQRSEGEGGAMGEDQQQPQRFQPPQQFGARWESPSQGQNA